VVKQFKNGPFIPNGPFGPGKAVFFGPDGTFSLEKTIVYVAYQPSVTATVDEHTYSRMKDSWKANAHISIGPSPSAVARAARPTMQLSRTGAELSRWRAALLIHRYWRHSV
jgi:hypothetical protein